MSRNSYLGMVVALLTFIAIGRILLTYRVTSVAWDEPCHIAAGVEWIDRGTYTLDPLHPPLSRLSIGLPLYFAGARIPQFPDQNLRHHDYYEVGTRILYDGGHYYRNLVLARLGVLPFFIFTTVLVFWWTRQIFGVLAALASVVLFTTTPSILAFAGLAYTDMTTACMQFATLFALATWMQKPNRIRTVLLGLALGLALLSKMTTLLYLPACAVGILLSRWMVGERREPLPKNGEQLGPQQHWKSKLGISVAIAVVVLWGGYRFSIGHVQEDMGLSPQAMPSFQHFPAPVRGLARRAIISDWVVPAPALIQGLSDAWVVNKMRLPSYMWGRTTNGGAWYFFFVALAVKAPLPLLVLWVAGVCFLLPAIRRKEWMPLIPATAVFMVLLVAITVQYKEGVRHILVVFPLLAVVAGHGAQALWSLSGGWRVIGKAVVVSLLVWQCVSSVRAGRDFISYYNMLAGSDPSRVYLTGCDLDCGQDIYRLAQEVRRRNIPALSIAAWSSSDIYQMELPKVELLKPYQPATGWVAISIRSRRLAQTFHTTYPVDAFSWLDQYKPVQQIGRTMSLYHIPASNPLPSTPDVTLPKQPRPTGS